MKNYSTEKLREIGLEEEKNLIYASSPLDNRDLAVLKRSFFNKAKKQSENQRSSNYYQGKRFEFDCWEFFQNLNPDVYNHPFHEFKFNLSEYAKHTPGQHKAYQKSKQTDLFCKFDNHAFVIECKSTSVGASSNSLNKEIELFQSLQQHKTKRLKVLFGKDIIPVYIFCIQGFNLSSEDQIKYLEERDIILLDETRREYIDEVLKTSGSAEFALNQFLGFFRKNKPDYNKKLKKGSRKEKWSIEAYHSLSGQKKKHKVYTFSISPEEMLKVSTVAHQKLNNIFEAEESVDKKYYQRLLTKSRLKELGTHLNEKSTPFPNNILVSYRGKTKLDFTSTGRKKVNVGNSPGTLRFNACPGTFHVIDGQHRLFGYTQVEKHKGIRENHRIIVTCFEGLSVEEEAEIFLEVNQNAKPVAAPLLMEIQFASGAISNENLCTGIVFKLRDDENSCLLEVIKQAEGKGSKASHTKKTGLLNPKNFQTSLSGLELFRSKSDIESCIFWDNDIYKTINNCYMVLNYQFSVFKEVNENYWFQKSEDKKGVLQDIFISGILGVFDRIIMETFKNNPKLSIEEFALETEKLTREFSVNYKNEKRAEKIKHLNISEFFKLGKSQALVTAYLINRYLNHHPLTRPSDEKNLKRFGTRDVSPEDFTALLNENERLEEELEQYLNKLKNKDFKSKSRSQRARTYHGILKDIVHLGFGKEEHYGKNYWESFVMTTWHKKGNVIDQVLDRWNEEKQKAGSNAWEHPIAHCEGQILRNFLFLIPRHRQVVLDKNKEERVSNTIKFIWENLIIPPEGEKLKEDLPPDNDAMWKKGTKYIEIFEEFRNVSVDAYDLDAPHKPVQGVKGNPTKPLEPEFDYYEKEFQTKLPYLIEFLQLGPAKGALK